MTTLSHTRLNTNAKVIDESCKKGSMKESGCTNIKDELEKDGCLILPIRGSSMMPLLRQDKDCVVVERASFNDLRPMDVVLYFNPTRDAYILHRLLWKKESASASFNNKKISEGTAGTGIKNNIAIILGDNCVNLEYVPEEWILGRLISFFRGEKKVQLTDPAYQKYVKFWAKPWKRRVVLIKIKNRFHHTASRVKHTIIRIFSKKIGTKSKEGGK